MWFLGEFWEFQLRLQVTEMDSCSRVLGFLGWDGGRCLNTASLLLLCVCVCVLLPRDQLFVTPWTVAPPRLLCSWDFPGKNTEVSCHSLLQRIFLTQGSNPDLLHCRQILYHLGNQGSKSTVVHNTTTMYNCSCLENSMDRGTWRATVNGVTKSRPRVSTSASAHVLLLTSIIISHANAN